MSHYISMTVWDRLYMAVVICQTQCGIRAVKLIKPFTFVGFYLASDIHITV